MERYTFGQELGRGALGITYKGYDNVLNINVAIKIIDIEKAQMPIEEINQELESMKILSSEPNCYQYIACYYDSGEILFEGRPSIMAVSEFIDGTTLSKYIKTLTQPPNGQVLWTMMFQLVSAVKHVHDLGFAHRDIKPDNIMREQSSGTLKLIDFGLACQTRCRSGAGTLDWFPPETFLRNPPNSLISSQAHDVWALGIVFYELANLGFPFNIVDSSGNYLPENQVVDTIVNGPYFVSEYNQSTFEYNQLINTIINDMIIYDWRERPSIDTIYNFMIQY
jgi:serine/threonine-protein kinase